jgi:retron-type reverse transcriptase
VAQAQAYVIEGYQFVVDFDLAKFFDRVNHDRLMAAVAKRVDDKRVLRLIRGFLTAGVLIDGLLEASLQGTPQGGPLSPLLSNLVLDELDRELGRRGHRFVRYADDCNIYVRSEAAGHRVMSSIARFIERRLKLQVNAEKSAVGRPWQGEAQVALPCLGAMEDDASAHCGTVLYARWCGRGGIARCPPIPIEVGVRWWNDRARRPSQPQDDPFYLS